MELYLEKLNQLISESQNEKIKTFEELDSTFTINVGASDNSIEECERYFNYKVPLDYKTFLRKYDGCVLYQIEDFAGFQFLSTKKLVDENSFQRTNFGEDWSEDIILFCLCIGDAEYIGFKVFSDKTYKIIYCIMDELPDTWKVIDTSFNNFVSKLIEEKGRKYWL